MTRPRPDFRTYSPIFQYDNRSSVDKRQHSTGTLAPLPAARAIFAGNDAISATTALRCRRHALVRPVPFERGRQSFVERDARPIAERGQFRNIGAAARRATLAHGRWAERDLPARDLGHAVGEIGDADLFRGAHVIDAEVLALPSHDHHALHQIVHVAEAARLGAAALDQERNRAAWVFFHCSLQTHGELRDDVIEAHVGPVDVVRAEDQHPFEMLAAVVDDHHLADDLAGAIGKARVVRIGNHERGALVGRHARRRLIDLRARGQDQASNAIVPAAVDDVDDALDADVEHEIGRTVERRRAVDEREVMHLVDAAHGGVDRGRIADVAADEFDVALDLPQPAQSSAGIVVEHAHRLALAHECLDQGRAEEAAGARDQDAPRAHPSAAPFLSAARRYHIGSADGKPISGPYKRLQNALGFSLADRQPHQSGLDHQGRTSSCLWCRIAWPRLAWPVHWSRPRARNCSPARMCPRPWRSPSRKPPSPPAPRTATAYRPPSSAATARCWSRSAATAPDRTPWRTASRRPTRCAPSAFRRARWKSG